LFLLPWLDRGKVKSIRYRGGIYKKALMLFVVSFIALGYLGTQPVTPLATIMARIFTAYYFGFFLLMPIYTRWEKLKPVPSHLTTQPTLEERIPDMIAVFNEVIETKSVTTEEGVTELKKHFNPTGAKNVLIRTAKNLKESLD
jgi:ubiquinol-cytochrome c reductase cytochrome b subunit